MKHGENVSAFSLINASPADVGGSLASVAQRIQEDVWLALALFMA